jgi:hypothetical protein
MRWIATLVATCLVALGALRGPRLSAPSEPREGAIEDATYVFAKLAPRRPTANAPDKRGERFVLVVPGAPPCVDRPAQLAPVTTLAAPGAPWLPSLLPRTSRGPPRSAGSASFTSPS